MKVLKSRYFSSDEARHGKLTKFVRIAALIVADMVVFNLSYFLAYMVRFEFSMRSGEFGEFFSAYADNFVFLTLLKVFVFFVLGMYHSLWDYAGSEELMKIVGTSFVASLSAVACLMLMQQHPAMPRSIYILSFIFDTALAGSVRFSYRYLRSARNRTGFSDFLSQFSRTPAVKQKITRVMLVGAGNAGASIIKEIKANPVMNMHVEVAIDDDPAKTGQTILGVKIAGNHSEIRLLARRHDIDEIIVAMPSAGRRQIQTIVNECNKTKCKVQILPSLRDLIDEKVSVSALRDVNIEDLLGRDPVKLDIKGISGYIEGRIIMVTGGGGSIGSELCRQIAKYKPRRLIALDNYENGVFELGDEMKIAYPELEFEAAIGSVRDHTRMKRLFEKYRPHVVFHAAAHKHVPLMEFNPSEAVMNNVLGTKNLVNLVDEYAVERFVMISTDKAVNPSNVMGATKRLAEMVVQEKSKHSHTAFAVVRFGNVLGSNGSVIPIFRKQIERGGPVTVTDKDITRYFMTIPEAVQLVMQAGAMTEGGEIFILDMGEPVRILDLAENIIKLSGYVPYEDIDIVITELRPGEKIYEELSYDNERLRKTAHDKIFLGTASEPSAELSAALQRKGESLEKIIAGHLALMTEDEVKAWLHSVLPEYKETEKRSVIRGVKIEDE
ncbi:MAG: polysaccharide biosynthesis protein [Clostridiales Family XIII bacterium]|jgi:FlaA1/EpsC-like NDP-sugar epimerase|nr:polysaccharide biosynthesis protein [Clostridiales Family XIII bacterium]